MKSGAGIHFRQGAGQYRLILLKCFNRENFYTLAWTTLRFGGSDIESSSTSGGKLNQTKSNILVSGGIRGEIRMFHPENKVNSPIKAIA